MLTHADYCGQTGNFGAVVIFHCDMSYTIEEHVAPPLESLVRCLRPRSLREHTLVA